jgi:hypothetical protein
MLYLLQLEGQVFNWKGENNMEVLDMNELELKEQAIKEFVNLQRVKTAENKDREIEYQEKVLKARLQALGIPTEDLELK